MWELDCEESWVPKNWCFWTVVLRRLLRDPWTARRSNQSILKISPGCSLEGMMLKLKLQYFGLLMQKTDSFEKTLMLGKIESRRRRGWQRMRQLDGITDSKDMSLSKLLEFAHIHLHWVSDAIQLSHPLPSPFPPALNLPQHQGPFQWVRSSYQAVKVLEFQLQHQSFQWIVRADFL